MVIDKTKNIKTMIRNQSWHLNYWQLLWELWNTLCGHWQLTGHCTLPTLCHSETWQRRLQVLLRHSSQVTTPCPTGNKSMFEYVLGCILIWFTKSVTINLHYDGKKSLFYRYLSSSRYCILRHLHFTIIGSDFPGDGQQCIVDSYQHICISECISLF